MKRKLIFAIVGFGLALAAMGFFISTQREDTSQVGTRAEAPAAPPPAPALPEAVRFSVAENGLATFLIDAPLEKIKGRSTQFRGALDLDPIDLTKIMGDIAVDLGVLKTETFEDAAKNAKQTEHTHNWMEIGADLPAKERETNRWARFTLRKVLLDGPIALRDVPETAGVRTVKVVAEGDLWLHGVTSAKKVPLTASFSGYPAGPVTVRVVSNKPFDISLKEHDIKPRDVAGKFLAGALERVGQKIDDRVQVSLDFTASAARTQVTATSAVK